MEKLNFAQRDSQEKDQKCSKLEDDMYDMQKKMASSRDDYEQQNYELEGNNLKIFHQTLAKCVTTKIYLCRT